MTGENPTNAIVFQIDQLLEEASMLAKTERDSARFYATLLQRTVLAVDAQAAAIWMQGNQSHPIVIAAHQLSALGRLREKTQQSIDLSVVQCIETGQAKKLSANGKSSALTVFCHPYDSGSGSHDAVIGIFFTKEVDADLAAVYASFLEAVAEIAADFGSRQNSRTPIHETPSATSASGSLSDWNRFKSLSEALHENLDVRSTATSLVNHGRTFYSCDRVLLAQKSGSKFKVIAASGAATVNRKSETVLVLESLIAKAYYRNIKPVILHSAQPHATHLTSALENYKAVTGNEFLMLCPHTDKHGLVKFVQIIEFAQENDLARLLKRLAMVEAQTNSALRNASQYQSIPMRGLLGSIGGTSLVMGLRRLSFPLALLALLGLAIAALCIFQTDLVVEADGNIVAETEKNVFAAKDGVVARLHVEHGDQVQLDQLLIEMSSNKIESDLSSIEGSIKTEVNRLAAIEAVKSALDRGSLEGQRELGRLSSQEIESKQRIENLNLELTLLQREQDRLQLKSPIAGTVTTRDAKTTLLDRPVHRGDILLRLVADDGKWLAKMRVPDSRIAHLMEMKSKQSNDDGTQQNWQNSVPVRLAVATLPGKNFQGAIRTVSNSADIDDTTGQAFIVVSVEIEHDDDIVFQPGSSVVAEFNCGQTSVGYAWFNQFIDSVRYRFF